MGVFAFVGLNESGKTTILEAIHSFSPEMETSELVRGDDTFGVPYKNRVPRHLISNFSDDVSVTATVKLDDEEKQLIVNSMKSEHNIFIDLDTIPDEIQFERYQRFENGDFIKNYFTLRTKIKVKTGKQKKWRKPTSDENVLLRGEIYQHTPDIAYFPTFVFDFPKQIFLTEEREDKVSDYYRQVFQDILDYDGQGHTIEDSIIRRVRSKDKIVSWLDFLNIWNSSDDKDKIQHVLDRASSIVTDVVFGRWNEIFGEDVKGKEINISFETVQGEKCYNDGTITQTNEHDLVIKFQVRDGTRRFNVNDRSLGFRWFFAFMLFTQFRVARENTRPILFLFDEPASNLHAAAQQKLIESFPEIARNDHTLAYTTHSHYLIEPKWLEQTFIVTNRADAPNEAVLDTLSLNDESLDIKATRYRSFINAYPGKTSYFQPILDRLEVVPSRFNIEYASIVVEGKSDYYVFRYATRLLKRNDLPLLPGLGAGTFGALVGLHIGWNLRMLFVLDGDKKGQEEHNRYIKEYGLPKSQITTIDKLLSGAKVIEDLLDDDALRIISSELKLSKKPTKKQILRFFQECLARDSIPSLGSGFKKNATIVLNELQKRLSQEIS
jgi:AAA15 family ATPase/GTPase